MPKETVVVEFDELPTFTQVVKDWESVCKRLDAGETPTYKMTETETRALYIWALKKRGYRISCAKALPGIFRLSKKG